MSLVRFIVELCTLMFAEAWCTIRACVHVTDAISLALTETIATAVSRSASATTARHSASSSLLCRLISQRLLLLHHLHHRLFLRTVSCNARNAKQSAPEDRKAYNCPYA